MFEEARDLWGRYCGIAEPETITRLAVRYINHINIPLPVDDLSNYFTAAPQIPDNIQGAISPTDRGVSADARALSSFFEEMLEDCSQSVLISANQSLNALYNLWEECSSENWDGYGAKPLDPYSFNEAERFIRALPTTVREPEVAVDPDGEISLEWHFFVSGSDQAKCIPVKGLE